MNTTYLIIGGFLLGIVIPIAFFGIAAAVKRTRRRLRILATVLRRAAEWGVAEQALRDRQGNGKWVGSQFNEIDHVLSLHSDLAEQNLLAAIRTANEEGINLHAFNALS